MMSTAPKATAPGQGIMRSALIRLFSPPFSNERRNLTSRRDDATVPVNRQQSRKDVTSGNRALGVSRVVVHTGAVVVEAQGGDDGTEETGGFLVEAFGVL